MVPEEYEHLAREDGSDCVGCVDHRAVVGWPVQVADCLLIVVDEDEAGHCPVRKFHAQSDAIYVSVNLVVLDGHPGIVEEGDIVVEADRVELLEGADHEDEEVEGPRIR